MSNSIHDFSDEELVKLLRVRSENVVWSPNNYREEIFRRSQDQNTRALNRWTAVITVATILNAIAAIIQATAVAGMFRNF